MSYLIRLFDSPAPGSEPAGPAFILRDSQLAGSPPYRLRGLPWRALQSATMIFGSAPERGSHAAWILGVGEQIRANGQSAFDSSAAKAPFGDLRSDHLDCADWEWSATQSRWIGHARDGERTVKAPLFAFWLEQALRYNRLALRLSHEPVAAFSYPPGKAALAKLDPFPLQAFQLQALEGEELLIFSFALDQASASPSLPAPACLPEPLADRLAKTARSEGLDAFDLLSHRDPQAAALRESIAIASHAPTAAHKATPRL